MLETTKIRFIELAIQYNALSFGEFTLKSGRISPYFFNMGCFHDGDALQTVGDCYAQTLLHHQVTFDHLFGPAYKGIPLATTTAVALARHHMNVSVTFNRKEAKDHGEGGLLIGAPLSGKTLIIDDVITAGTAFREAKQHIQVAGGQLQGVIIALDRCERGLSTRSSVDEIRADGLAVYAIITLFDLMAYLQQQERFQDLEHLKAYHARYGT